jgi:hypothetical protein
MALRCPPIRAECHDCPAPPAVGGEAGQGDHGQKVRTKLVLTLHAKRGRCCTCSTQGTSQCCSSRTRSRMDQQRRRTKRSVPPHSEALCYALWATLPSRCSVPSASQYLTALAWMFKQRLSPREAINKELLTKSPNCSRTLIRPSQ